MQRESESLDRMLDELTGTSKADRLAEIDRRIDTWATQAATHEHPQSLRTELLAVR